MELTFKELKERNLLEGLDELSKIEGTRTDIFHEIAKHNKLAITNCREAGVKINGISMLVLLKRVSKGVYKIDCFWDCTNNILYFNN